jgi:hypothetical protein
MLNRAIKFGFSIGKCETKIVLAKNRKQLFPKCLCVLAMLLILGTFLKVAAFGIGSISLGGRVEKAVTGFGQNDENIEKSVSKRHEAIKSLKQRNMFGPPAPKPKPPVCTGVLGDTAIMNGKAYKVGQDVGGAKVVSIGPMEVMILWQGKEMKLPAFGVGKIAPSASARRRPVQKVSKKPEARPVEQTAVASNTMARPEGMRRDFRNMSPEEREAYRRARRERGERGGRGEGGGRGDRRRPRDRTGPRDRPRDREGSRER